MSDARSFTSSTWSLSYYVERWLCRFANRWFLSCSSINSRLVRRRVRHLAIRYQLMLCYRLLNRYFFLVEVVNNVKEEKPVPVNISVIGTNTVGYIWIHVQWWSGSSQIHVWIDCSSSFCRSSGGEWLTRQLQVEALDALTYFPSFQLLWVVLGDT